jgi:hypothetical protein
MEEKIEVTAIFIGMIGMIVYSDLEQTFSKGSIVFGCFTAAIFMLFTIMMSGRHKELTMCTISIIVVGVILGCMKLDSFDLIMNSDFSDLGRADIIIIGYVLLIYILAKFEGKQLRKEDEAKYKNLMKEIAKQCVDEIQAGIDDKNEELKKNPSKTN